MALFSQSVKISDTKILQWRNVFLQIARPARGSRAEGSEKRVVTKAKKKKSIVEDYGFF
jgi:hypothetical protein